MYDFKEIEEHEAYVAASHLEELVKVADAANAFRQLLWEMELKGELSPARIEEMEAISKRTESIIDPILERADEVYGTD